MKESLLITGAGPNGVTGKLIKNYFQNKYNILTPSSRELDLRNAQAVDNFFKENKINYIIHCATFRNNITNTSDNNQDLLESNLRMFSSLAKQSSKVKKMIYFGSGAEYDKSRNINLIKEEQFGSSIPKDNYGFGKYLMNLLCHNSHNIYNFRLFGTINPYEKYNKNVISNLCAKAILNIPLTLKQDCKFSFIDMHDVLILLEQALNENLKNKDYNITNSTPILLSDIAKIIIDISQDGNNELYIEKEGLNLEYTASNKRLINEFNPSFTDIVDAINGVYQYYKNNPDSINASEIDKRWE